MHPLLPVAQHLGQRPRAVRFLPGEIPLFPHIIPQVVQLQRLVFEILDQLPIPLPHRTAGPTPPLITREVPEQRFTTWQFSPL
jgi:hypothetical protein